mmetsp:Transcript_17664/g.58011  ORF Transcript_17664/g.58011 Transcript_17664/m.58011 type:complete len:221 (-) Transcript_17664:198-860(-)
MAVKLPHPRAVATLSGCETQAPDRTSASLVPRHWREGHAEEGGGLRLGRRRLAQDLPVLRQDTRPTAYAKLRLLAGECIVRLLAGPPLDSRRRLLANQLAGVRLLVVRLGGGGGQGSDAARWRHEMRGPDARCAGERRHSRSQAQKHQSGRVRHSRKMKSAKKSRPFCSTIPRQQRSPAKISVRRSIIERSMARPSAAAAGEPVRAESAPGKLALGAQPP